MRPGILRNVSMLIHVGRRRSPGRSPRVGVAVLLVVALVFAACGADDTTEPTEANAATEATTAATEAPADDSGTTAATTAETTAATEALAPARDTLRVFSIINARSIDPVTAGSTDAVLLHQIYDGLTKNDWSAYSAVDWIGEVTQEDDGNFLIKLREDVTFHEGEPLTPDDIVFSFERYTDPDAASRTGALFASIVSEVQIVDDQTVRFMVIDAPQPQLYENLYAFRPMQRAWTESHDLEYLTTHANGTGPYKVVNFVPEQIIELEAFEDYWAGAPQIPKMTIRLNVDAAAALIAIQRGEADIVCCIPVDLVEAAEGAGYIIQSISAFGTGFMPLYTLDAENPVDPGQPNPLLDVRVRRALNFAVDKQLIIDNVLGGHAAPMATGPDRGIHPIPSMQAYQPGSEFTDYGHNPDMARQLLGEAGYADGFTHRIIVPEGLYEKGSEIALAVADQLNDYGIRTSIEPMPISPWVTLLFAGEPGNNLGPSYLDLGYNFTAVDSRNLPRNITSRFKVTEDAELVAAHEATLVVDVDEQVAALKALDKILWEGAVGLFLWHPQFIFAVAPDLDWTALPQRYFNDFNAAFFVGG